MKMRQLISVLGLLLLIVAVAPPAAEAQNRRTPGYQRYGGNTGGRYGQPPGGRRGETIGGPYNTYPVDRSAAPCLEGGSFGPNNVYQTPYNGPYGFPGQHPCQFDWASMNRQKEDVWLGRTNVLLGAGNLGVGIWNLTRTGKNNKLLQQNLQVSLEIRDLLARQPVQPVIQQQQSMNVNEPPRYHGNRPRHEPSSLTFVNCEKEPVLLVNRQTGEEVWLDPFRSARDRVTRPWNPNDVSASFTSGTQLSLVQSGSQVGITR